MYVGVNRTNRVCPFYIRKEEALDTNTAVMAELGYSSERIGEQGTGNAMAAILTTLLYLKEHHQSVEEWVAFLGRSYAPGWENLRGKGAKAFARMAALNFVSVGANLLSLAGNETHAELTATWPSQEWLDFVGVSKGDSDAFCGVFGPIAEHLGLHYEWHRDGEQIRLKFTAH